MYHSTKDKNRSLCFLEWSGLKFFIKQSFFVLKFWSNLNNQFSYIHKGEGMKSFINIEFKSTWYLYHLLLCWYPSMPTILPMLKDHLLQPQNWNLPRWEGWCCLLRVGVPTFSRDFKYRKSGKMVYFILSSFIIGTIFYVT